MGGGSSTTDMDWMLLRACGVKVVRRQLRAVDSIYARIKLCLSDVYGNHSYAMLKGDS